MTSLRIGRSRRAAIGLATLSAVALLATGCAPAATGGGDENEAEPIVLKYASIYAETAFEDVETSWFLDRVEEATDGRVTFDRYYDGSLVTTPDFPAALNDGRIDLANLVVTNYPSDFPLWQASYIPIADTNNVAHSLAQQQLLTENEAFASEIADNGMHFVAFKAPNPLGIASQFPFESADDLEGLQVRANGLFAFQVSAFGGNPVTVSVEEAFDALQRGTINAFAGTHIGYWSTSGLYKVAPWLNDLRLGAFGGQALAFSDDAWSQISEADQAIITEIAGDEWYEYQSEALTEVTETGCETVLSGTGGVSVLSDKEAEKAREKLGDSLWETWRATAITAGYSEDEVEGFENALKERAVELADATDYDGGSLADCAEKSEIHRP